MPSFGFSLVADPGASSWLPLCALADQPPAKGLIVFERRRAARSGRAAEGLSI